MSLGDREAESVAFKHDAVQIHGAWLPEPFKRPLMSPCPLVQRLQLVIAWKQRHYNVIRTFDTEDAPFKDERNAFCGKMFTDLALNCFQISSFFGSILMKCVLMVEGSSPSVSEKKQMCQKFQ